VPVKKTEVIMNQSLYVWRLLQQRTVVSPISELHSDFFSENSYEIEKNELK
jgi:hypothetical protein